ncbi:hypothetical protein KY346_03345 [Candidatus Woesearchaeota archaeon]|nr:hypothetical protein [Candidatus Woesearchaeota archaeon]
MADYLQKKKVKKALEKARELEKEHVLTPKEEIELQKEAVSLSEKLKKLLKPAWFVSPPKRRAKAVKKKVKKKTRKKAKKKKK